MKNLHKPVFATTVIIASLAFTTLASAHGTSRHASMAGQSMSGQSKQGQMMRQGQMGQRRNMTTSRMQHRGDHRLKNRSMGNHQRLESHDTTGNDPDFKAAFAAD